MDIDKAVRIVRRTICTVLFYLGCSRAFLKFLYLNLQHSVCCNERTVRSNFTNAKQVKSVYGLSEFFDIL